MEQISLIGSQLMNLVKNGNCVTFDVDAFGFILNLKICGIETIKRNNEIITELNQIESNIIDVYSDTEEYPINELIISFENGDVYKMNGEMELTVLNMVEFNNFINQFEDEHSCHCGGNCQKQSCGCK